MATIVRERRVYASGYSGIYWIHRVLNTLLTIVNVLLLIRLLLKALGANPGSGFVNLIYSVTAPLVSPFVGIFNNAAVDTGYFEWASLIAIIIYSLAVVLIEYVVDLIARPRDTTIVP
jgi:uncharacterized protein YggT (Ycf19 family)